MDYSELLIGYAQLMVTLAGFSALMLNLPARSKDEVHLGWAVRALTIQAVFAVLVSLCGLAVLSTNLPAGETWRLCSLVYVFLAAPTFMVSSWDNRRVQRTGARVKSPTLLVIIWVITVFSIGSNVINTIIAAPAYAYFFWGPIGNAICGSILFTRNVFEYTHDPDEHHAIDEAHDEADGITVKIL